MQKLLNIHKTRWKAGTWARKNLLDFGGNPDHIRLRLRLGEGRVILCDTEFGDGDDVDGVCFSFGVFNSNSI